MPTGTFQPLTQDQYNKAVKAGFSPTQILANEKIRKQSYTAAPTPAQPESALSEAAKNTVQTYKDLPGKLSSDVQGAAADIQKGGAGNVTKGIVKGALRPAADVAGAIFAPVSSAIGAVMDKTGAQKALTSASQWLVDKSGIADNPAVQDFANKHPNAVEDFSRALMLIMSGAGNEDITAKGLKDVATSPVEGAKVLAGTIKNAVSPSPEDVVAKLPKAIDENYAKAFGTKAKKNLKLTQSQIESQREAVQIINDNTPNLKYTNPEAGVYDSGRAPKTVGEHAQALLQTKDAVMDKLTTALDNSKALTTLSKPLEIMAAKLKTLNPASDEYAPLAALYAKYKGAGTVTAKELSGFLQDLNDASRPMLESGSNKPTARVSLSVANLFRQELDTMAQQSGSPEISLLRRQWGALDSVEQDAARAFNKELKGKGGGGVSRLNDLFSGEEILRGVLTLNPEAVLMGAGAQGLKFGLAWLRSADRYVNKMYSSIEKASGVAQKGGVTIPRMQSPYAPVEKPGALVVRPPGNPNTANPPDVIPLPEQSQSTKVLGQGKAEVEGAKVGTTQTRPGGLKQYTNEGKIVKSVTDKSLSTTQATEPVSVKTPLKGNFLNIGLKVGESGSITPEEAINAIKALGGKVLQSKVVQSGTEPTLFVKMPVALTPQEVYQLAVALKQEAIPQFSANGTTGIGRLIGTNAAGWGKFNPEYFLDMSGKPIKIGGSIKKAAK